LAASSPTGISITLPVRRSGASGWPETNPNHQNRRGSPPAVFFVETSGYQKVQL
jgi:hypothetical protein